MKKYLIIILIGGFFGLCKKEEQPIDCSGDYCLGKISSNLSPSEKNYIPTEDNMIKYVNDDQDTVKLILRKIETKRFVHREFCQCSDKNTDFDGEGHMSIYKLYNEDLALLYNVATTYTSGIVLNVYFSDTNMVIHEIYKQTNPCSQFQISDYSKKKNDFDSLLINGKWYFNVIKSFDYVGQCQTSRVKDVLFSKGVGLIQLTYRDKVYRRIN